MLKTSLYVKLGFTVFLNNIIFQGFSSKLKLITFLRADMYRFSFFKSYNLGIKSISLQKKYFK